MRLLPFAASQAREVIERPGSDLLDSGATDAILSAVARARRSGESAAAAVESDTPIDPALLSLLLHELFKLAAGNKITTALVQENERSILDGFFERTFAALGPAIRDELRCFVEDELVSPNGFRSSRGLDEAIGTPGVTRELLDALVDARLLRWDPRSGGQEAIELTHDVLCDPIVRSRTSRREREALARTERERREEEARRHKAEEEREKELALRLEAEEATEIAEMAESRARRALLVVGVLAVVCLLVGAFAWLQFLQVKKTENRLKATTARAENTAVRADFDLALIYEQSFGNEPRTFAHLAHALRIKPDARLPRSYLVSLLRDKPWILPISEPMQHRRPVNSASFSNDGNRVVTASSDNTARVWDTFVDVESELPSWVPDLAETLGGQRFDENGFLVTAQRDLFTLRKELLALKGDDFWSRFGRWFATRGPERTVSPNATLTVGELERLKAEAEKAQAP